MVDLVSMMKKVCLGGTFDMFHVGHEALIHKALEVGEKVLIGLTTDERAKNSRPDTSLSLYSKRRDVIESWLKEQKYFHRVEIVPLNDDWGPAALGEEYEGIIVSEETEKKATLLNLSRLENGSQPLRIIVVPMLKAYDGRRISSSRIRKGEIDSKGLIS